MGKECQTIAILTSKLCQYVIAQTVQMVPPFLLYMYASWHLERKWHRTPGTSAFTSSLNYGSLSTLINAPDIWDGSKSPMKNRGFAVWSVDFKIWCFIRVPICPSKYFYRIDCKDPNLRSSNDKQTAGVYLEFNQPNSSKLTTWRQRSANTRNKFICICFGMYILISISVLAMDGS